MSSGLTPGGSRRAHPGFLPVVLVALRQARPRGADGMGRPVDGRCAALRGATRRSATSSTARS